jgi:hypothetical protein
VTVIIILWRQTLISAFLLYLPNRSNSKYKISKIQPLGRNVLAFKKIKLFSQKSLYKVSITSPKSHWKNFKLKNKKQRPVVECSLLNKKHSYNIVLWFQRRENTCCISLISIKIINLPFRMKLSSIVDILSTKPVYQHFREYKHDKDHYQ